MVDERQGGDVAFETYSLYIGDMSDKEYQREVLVEHGILAVSDKC